MSVFLGEQRTSCFPQYSQAWRLNSYFCMHAECAKKNLHNRPNNEGSNLYFTGFLESLWRDIDLKRLHRDPSHDLNLIIVSHGLTCRVFLMKWFKWTVEQFERLNNPGNCEFRIMQLGPGGDYSLAIHHTDEEMLEWGLSPEMIDDQKWRMHANKGEWNEKCPWYLDEFFDHVADSDRESDGKENGSSGMCE
ncbi:hypothetical protein OIU76_002939 [Salix suchowensis]|nr:hypothetical protein OIU76_002939 [Salix suchowensis]